MNSLLWLLKNFQKLKVIFFVMEIGTCNQNVHHFHIGVFKITYWKMYQFSFTFIQAS